MRICQHRYVEGYPQVFVEGAKVVIAALLAWRSGRGKSSEFSFAKLRKILNRVFEIFQNHRPRWFRILFEVFQKQSLSKLRIWRCEVQNVPRGSSEASNLALGIGRTTVSEKR